MGLEPSILFDWNGFGLGKHIRVEVKKPIIYPHMSWGTDVVVWVGGNHAQDMHICALSCCCLPYRWVPDLQIYWRNWMENTLWTHQDEWMDGSGQISSRPHTGPDFPQKVAFRKGNPLFQGNLGW